ncbi:MAG: (4Fe-4S)-binding protein [Bacteroidetes bacterium]|nr:(4Fe-4S)-binding protein [Bacteroidota bacterium]
MEDITKKYENGEITVTWQPHLCAHSGNCVRGLPAVFDNTAKPWINIHKADSNAIIDQVKRCPSGALSVTQNK